MQNGDVFELHVSGLKLVVTPYLVNDYDVYSIVFSDGRPPLAVTETCKGHKLSFTRYWTSLPEGRPKEARIFGEKIEEYIKNKGG